jgi:hypothetical protein
MTNLKKIEVLKSRATYVRLRLQLVKNFGSGPSLAKISAPAPAIFPLNFREKKSKIDDFMLFFKTKNDHQKVLKKKQLRKIFLTLLLIIV